MARITEANIFQLMILILAFLYVNFDRQMAILYIILIVADFIWWFTDLYIADKRITFPTEKTDTNRAKSVFIAFIAYMGFLIITTVAFSVFNPQALTQTQATQSGFGAIISLLATTTPILKDSLIITFISWGIFIPIIETRFFFGRLLEGFALLWKNLTGEVIPLNRLTPKTWLLIAVMSAMFTLFHLVAKGAQSLPLLVTFVFGIVSGALVIRDQELKSAILLHIFSNSVAVLSNFGMI